MTAARRRRGFTLIEVLVVIGIVAILALLAIPNYSGRIVQDQVLEALPLAEVAKPPVAAGWALAQTFPADNAAAALPQADKIVGNLVSAVAVENGAIHITFGNRANNQILGKVLTLRPAVVDDAPVVPITWVCGFAPVPAKMSARGMNRTTIPQNLLPLKCRGT
jgi:type IV pilus assembly protein PilA